MLDGISLKKRPKGVGKTGQNGPKVSVVFDQNGPKVSGNECISGGMIDFFVSHAKFVKRPKGVGK